MFITVHIERLASHIGGLSRYKDQISDTADYRLPVSATIQDEIYTTPAAETVTTRTVHVVPMETMPWE